MNVDYANPFLRAAAEVFQKETGIKLSRKDLKLKPAPVPTLDTTVVIGVTGPIQGQIVFSMDSSFAFAVAKAMLPGKLPIDQKRFTNSAVSEIANMISGKASIELAGEDKMIHITPPAVFNGVGLSVDFLSIPTISLSFISEVGVLEVNIALRG